MMKFAITFLLLLPLASFAQDAPQEAAPQAADDAYSPSRAALQQMTNQLPQEEVPQNAAEITEPVIDQSVAEQIAAEQQELIENGELKSTDEQAKPDEPEPIMTEMIEAKKATLQILDKIDARVAEVEVELEKEKEYNELKIEVKRCIRSPQESKEENLAFMRIWDVGQGDYTNIVFSGWMISSNPALHSFEHPLYDIVLLRCSD